MNAPKLAILPIRLTFAFVLFLSTLAVVPYIALAKEPEAIRNTTALTLTIEGVDDNAVLDNIRNSVPLFQQLLDKSFVAPTEEYDWQRLIETTERQVIEAVKPYGFYQPNVEVERIRSSRLIIKVALGHAVIVDKLTLTVSGMAENEAEVQSWVSSFPMRQGSRLVQPDYDSAKAALNKILKRLGYFEAEFSKQEIVINNKRTRAQVSLQMDSGVRYRFGEFQVNWMSEQNRALYSDRFLQRFLTLQSGQPFDSKALQKEQSDMGGSVYFSLAELRPLLDQAVDGSVPIQVTLGAPDRFAYGASLGLGTDTGPRAGLSFDNRRVNRLGHRLNTELNVSAEKQNVAANYSIPTNGSKRDGLNLFTSYINEDSDVRDSRLSLLGFDFNRSLSERTQLSYGLSFRDEQFVESGVEQDSRLIMPSLTWQTVHADDLRNPNRGYRLSASLRAAEENVGSDISFVQINASAKSVFSIGSGRLLGRAHVAQTLISDADKLPASLSFFTGGDHGVRGYAFESIGVPGDDGEILGGKNLLTASLEYEHAIRGPFALAAFADLGDAYDSSLDLKLGLGIGARWRLPFGAVRLDIASAQDRDGKPVRLHFTFGTDL